MMKLTEYVTWTVGVLVGLAIAAVLMLKWIYRAIRSDWPDMSDAITEAIHEVEELKSRLKRRH